MIFIFLVVLIVINDLIASSADFIAQQDIVESGE